MATPVEKFAESLFGLEKLQKEKGIAIIKADELSRIHKERLVENGFIREVIKGWYLSYSSDEKQGETTSWYVSYWNFIASYFDSKVQIPHKNDRKEIEGVRVYSLEAGLAAVGADFYARHPIDARTCLAMVKDSSGVLAKLLDGGKIVVAGRMVVAFRNIGNDKIANDILVTMKSAGYDVRESDPFMEKMELELNSREASPYINRIKIMWKQMRDVVIKYFPDVPVEVLSANDYLQQVQENYSSDVYHSLSIEGYRVTP